MRRLVGAFVAAAAIWMILPPLKRIWRMRNIDMSAEAVTARLKLVSELTRLCLLLGTAKLKSPEGRAGKQKRQTRTPR